MMTEAEKWLMIDLELLYDKWTLEWAERVRTDTQPTREDERRHLVEFKKVITNHFKVDIRNMEGYLE